MSEWISVKDRLPEEGATVVLHTEQDAEPTSMVGRYLGASWSMLSWCCGCTSPVSCVTHWMPLPAAPKEGS